MEKGLAPGIYIQDLNFDQGDQGRSKVTLLAYVLNHALSKLAALVGISLRNTDEERDRMISLMRRRASDREGYLCKTKKATKVEMNKRRI